MDVQADPDLLAADLAEAIAWSRRSRRRDRRLALRVALYGGAVSALTTVLIGLASLWPEQARLLQALALITSASLTVIAAWDGIFNHRKLWVNAAVTLNELYEIDADLRHLRAAGADRAAFDGLYQRYKEVMRSTNQRWCQIREAGGESPAAA
ncbi:MAG: SLATT domain-containing protein [Planctomycetota bacterium]|jgi:hypothetical protein